MSADFVEPRPLHKLPVKSGRDVLDAQYKSGRTIIDKAEWAREAFEQLRRRCPHVPEEHLVRLFHDKAPSQLELIQGAAILAEYNATHPLGRRRVRPRRARGLPAAGGSRPVAKKAKPRAAARPKAPARASRPARKAVAKARRRR